LAVGPTGGDQSNIDFRRSMSESQWLSLSEEKNVHVRGRLSGGETSHGGGKGKGDSQSLLVSVELQLSVSA